MILPNIISRNTLLTATSWTDAEVRAEFARKWPTFNDFEWLDPFPPVIEKILMMSPKEVDLFVETVEFWGIAYGDLDRVTLGEHAEIVALLIERFSELNASIEHDMHHHSDDDLHNGYIVGTFCGVAYEINTKKNKEVTIHWDWNFKKNKPTIRMYRPC